MSKMTIIEGNSNDKDNTRVIMVKGEKGDKGDNGEITYSDVVDNLTSTSTQYPLSAKQGKILKGLIDDNETKTEEMFGDLIQNTLVCNLEYRECDEYIDGITDTSNFVKGYLQGFTTTENSYILAIRESNITNQYSNNVLLQEVSKSTKQVIKQNVLELGHANSITYNKNTGKIYVAVGNSYNNNNELIQDNRIIEVDYENFTITNTITFNDIIIASVSYDIKTNKYLIGASELFYVTSDLETIEKTININLDDTAPKQNGVLNRNITIQNAVMYNSRIYLTRFFANGIVVLDNDGNVLQNYYSFDIDAPVRIEELEAISIEENGYIYIASMQTAGSDLHKYTLYDRMIIKSNLIYNGYKQYDYINATSSKLIMYVDKNTTNHIEIGTEQKPFSTIQQAIMATEFIKKDLGVIINCVGQNKNYGMIVAKGTKYFRLNGNNNNLYGAQLQSQNCRIENITFNLDTDISVVSETIKSNIKINADCNILFENCSFINNEVEKKDNGLYCEDSKLELYSSTFTNLVNGIYLMNAELYIKDGITGNSLDNYFYTRGSTQIFQNSGAVLNRCNKNANNIPLVFATSQSVRLTEGSTHLIEFDNKNVESSNTGRNQFLVEFSIKVGTASADPTFSSIFTLFKTDHHTFTFINAAKTKIYTLDFTLTHTNNSGIWDINALRLMETTIADGSITEMTSPTFTINAVRTLY